jgi:hypothetical protein
MVMLDGRNVRMVRPSVEFVSTGVVQLELDVAVVEVASLVVAVEFVATVWLLLLAEELARTVVDVANDPRLLLVSFCVACTWLVEAVGPSLP